MKVRGLALCMVSVLALATAGAIAGEGGVALGAAAPNKTVKMKNVDGRDLSVADVEGKKGTLVIFTCNACPYVKAWEERIVGLGNEYSAKGVGVIAINSNDPGIVPEDGFDTMKDRAKKRSMSFPYVVDEGSAVAKAFGATRTPEAFLFDAEGKLVYHGTVDDNFKEPDKVTKRYLKDALEAVVSGQPVPLAETKALGCGIKFKAKA